MKAYSLAAFGEPLIERELPIPIPTGRAVVIKVKATGVCHSDLHIWEGGYDLGHGRKVSLVDRGVRLPHTLGHETSGDVVAVGPDAWDEVVVGATYLVDPWIGCGQCAHCRRGEENLCPAPRVFGVQVDGGYAEYALVSDARHLIPIGDLDAAELAPYACSGVTTYSAIRKLGDAIHRGPVVVIGIGALGLMAINILRALDATGAIALDLDPAKRALALEAGAIAALDPLAPDIVRQIQQACGGSCDAIIDLVGSPRTFGTAFDALAKGGKLILIGLHGDLATFPLASLAMRGISVIGSLAGNLGELKELIALVRQGKVRPIPVQRVALDRATDMLIGLRDGKVQGRAVLCPHDPDRVAMPATGAGAGADHAG